MTEPSNPVQNEPAGSAQPASEERHERKYSMLQRFYKLIVSPSETMKDIAHWPDYGGPVVLVILRIILANVSILLIFQKIQLTGDSQIISQVQSILFEDWTLIVLLSLVLFFVFWLVKSWLVKVLCNVESDWEFETAASVTGYAYLADVIFSALGLLVIYPLLPSITLNVSDLDAARQAVANFQAQTLWIELVISLPIDFIALTWKSYLGGLGTMFGTDEKCTMRWGFIVFFVLALFGWLISFLARGTI